MIAFTFTNANAKMRYVISDFIIDEAKMGADAGEIERENIAGNAIAILFMCRSYLTRRHGMDSKPIAIPRYLLYIACNLFLHSIYIQTQRQVPNCANFDCVQMFFECPCLFTCLFIHFALCLADAVFDSRL